MKSSMILRACHFHKEVDFSNVYITQEVLSFLEQLVSCMGQNMQFNIEHICEGNNHTAMVNWHIGILSNTQFPWIV